MVSPSIWALTPGTSRSAWTTAFAKNDMKPSLRPFFFTKSSWYLARSAMTADMSTSLNVVSIAASCLAGWGRSASNGGSGIDRGDDLADFDLVAGGGFEGDFSGGLGRAFARNLVRLEFEQRLVFFHDIAVGDVPLGENAGRDGFAHRG